MGAFCSGCSKRGKRRVGVEDLPPHLRSKEILDELRAIGIITAATSGGMTFDIQPDGRIKASVPRRLPALLGQNRAHGGQVAQSLKERTQKAEERRSQVLDERRKMGRDFNKKKEAVLQRREDLMLAKIRRTEAKLRRRPEES